MENLIDSQMGSQKLELDDNALMHLKETRKWTFLLSILGFIFMGLMLIVMIFAGSSMSRYGWPASSSTFSILMVILLLIIYFFPIYYLLMFSQYSRQAINHLDNLSLTNALKFLKLHYRFMGILVIIVLGIYLIAILGMLASGSFFGTLPRSF